MDHVEKNLGVQSYCFRRFTDNSIVAKKVRGIGLDKIELCGVHADFNAPGQFADVVRIYADAGVEIVSLGVQTFTGADSGKAWFECAAAAGARHISAHFQMNLPQRHSESPRLVQGVWNPGRLSKCPTPP